jgi:hypothetical protein
MVSWERVLSTVRPWQNPFQRSCDHIVNALTGWATLSFSRIDRQLTPSVHVCACGDPFGFV